MEGEEEEWHGEEDEKALLSELEQGLPCYSSMRWDLLVDLSAIRGRVSI
jgi:hypothetical protein